MGNIVVLEEVLVVPGLGFNLLSATPVDQAVVAHGMKDGVAPEGWVMDVRQVDTPAPLAQSLQRQIDTLSPPTTLHLSSKTSAATELTWHGHFGHLAPSSVRQ
ncbi:hypothetical protein IAT38_007209 [Cryptococcus sp. DSM 104549]